MTNETLCALADPGSTVCGTCAGLGYRECRMESPAEAPSGDGPIREGWQITLGEGHSGYGVYAHMEEYPEEGAVLLLAAKDASTPQQANKETP